MNRESLPFGHGSFVGQVMNNPDFFDMPVREQARILGWVDSCPVVLELTDPNNTNPGRGPEAMLRRYGEINLWFGFIQRAVGEVKPNLKDELVSTVPRLSDEPVGKFESESVPDYNEDFIAPMGTLAGYGLPRIMIEQLNAGDDISPRAVQDRMVTGLMALDKAIESADTPMELLAEFAEELLCMGNVRHDKILKHILSKGWLEEHNAHTMLAEFKKVLENRAPTLWSTYTTMSAYQKHVLGLVQQGRV
jgi:hypothetical protein